MNFGAAEVVQQNVTTGRVVASRYKLLAVIGRGPHGVVWSVRDVGTGQLLALKLLELPLGQTPDVVDRFRRERGVLTAFLTAAFVRVLDMIEADGSIGLVTEQVPGVDLQRHLDGPGPLTANPISVVRRVAEALDAAHATGVVHCGVKPTNILVTSDGSVRLSDCRIARLARDPDGRASTDSYTAPEAGADGAPVAASDVYSLGRVLGDLLARAPIADPRLAHLMDLCLDPDPTNRPSAGEVAVSLTAIETPPRTAAADATPDRPVTQTPPPLVPSGRIGPERPRRRVRARAVALTVALATCVAAAALAVVLRATLASGARGDATHTDSSPAASVIHATEPGSAPRGSGASQDVSP